MPLRPRNTLNHRLSRLGLALAALASSTALVLTAQAQTPAVSPVTDAMLQNPSPGDWLNWRRTLDGWGYSPLDQINTKNAHQLQLVWAGVIGPGISEPTPLVHDGVMYLAHPAGVVQALDAVTGDVLWDYTKKFDSDKHAFPPRARSIAIYGENIYLATADAHIVALHARTGAVVWDHTVADHTLGYRYTSGPIVVKGRIVAGMTGCEYYKNDVCFISAHDARTGKEVWRTPTIARPGTPGGETWGDLPLMFRAGGDAWIPGSYDPATDLIYWSTAQAKPWARVSRGSDGDALYTNSLLAINPDTGALAWYYQFVPGETHDLDEVFESVLIDRPGRKSLFKMGKLGILWEIDRTTGKFVAARDLGYQDLVEVNPTTGKVLYHADKIPKSGIPVDFCPGFQGVRNWRATAYHPATQALYIPITPACQRSVFTEVERKEGGAGYGQIGHRMLRGFPHPASPQHRGGFLAMDIATGRILWRQPLTVSPTSAALTTGGGLAIVGDGSRYLYLHDAATGAVLFRTRLPVPAQGFPITYAVRGRQYLAVPIGTGGYVGEGTAAAPPASQNGIFVFAVPEARPGAAK
jgi:alcohol dehydrogenase (cytochrome c)